MNTVVSVASLASAAAVAAPSIEPHQSRADSVLELIEQHRALQASADDAHATWQNALESRPERPYHPLKFGARVKVGEQNGIEIERAEQNHSGCVITCKTNGRIEPIYAYSADDIESKAPKGLAEPELNAWVAKHVTELDRQHDKLRRRQRSTRFGRLESAWIDAADLASNAAWALVTAIPTSLESAAARLAYIRNCAHPRQEIADDLDMTEALRNTTEAALWDLAGVPAPASLEAYFEVPEEGSSEDGAEAA